MLSLRLTLVNTLFCSIFAAFLIQRTNLFSSQTPSLLSGTYLILFLITALRLIWGCYIYPHYRSPLRHLPKPPDKPSFLMGHFFQMLEGNPGVILRSWTNTLPKSDLIRYLDFANLERVTPITPAALADILVHKCYDFEKPAELRKGISRILGLGLFLAEGDVHKRQRKLLMPAFAYRHVQNLYPMFWEKSKELMTAIMASKGESLNAESNESICVEVNQWASRATLDIIGQGGFGQSFNAIQDPDNAISKTYRSLFRPDKRGQILGVLGFLLPVWVVKQLPFLRNDQMKQTSEFIRRVCQDAIDAKRQKPKFDLEEERDILSVAMDSGAFSDEELVDQMMTFLAAGHETSASALTWAIYLLAKHPNIQSRLRDELTQSPLPHPSDDPISSPIVTAETIEKLPYLNAVCREVLRLFPPVSVTIRVAVRDTSICNQVIPKGTTIMIPPWAVNANPALWGDDAGEFSPERWRGNANENSLTAVAMAEGKGGGGGTNYNFLTFLQGPRSCIGQSFAVGELKCLVAAWVGAFETSLKDPDFVPVVKGGITAKPKDGLFVRVRPVGGGTS